MVTNMYPTPESPVYGVFIRSQIESIAAAGHDVEVIFIDGRESRMNYLRGVQRLRQLTSSRKFDLIHAHYGLSGLVACAQRRLPVVLSYCGDDLFGTSDGNGGITPGSHLVVWAGQLVSLAVRKIILKSERMRGELRFESAREKAVVIPNGVDFGRFKPMPRGEARSRLSWATDDRRILFPSAAPDKAVKRYDLARDAVGRLRDFDPGLEMVLLGNVSPEKVPLYMNACDAMVLTSDSEGSPNVIKEAMACNLPIVSVDAGDAWQVIGESRHCYRTDRSTAAIAEGLRKALEPGERSDGRNRIAHLELGKISERVIDVYESALGTS
jgi:teichuronic acid biosynthesis glycosyltransferase TuaC